VTKRLGEVWTQLLGGVSVRVWNAYGVLEEQGIKSHAISDFIFQALKTGKITMMTNGQEWRQFTHIKDISKAFYMALNSPVRRKTIYDASSYEWVRIIDIAHMIAHKTGAKVIPGKIKGHDPLPAFNMGRVPGWLPEIDLTQGLDEMMKDAQARIGTYG
jgi:nucleoside-diphosphate-sugar epimerase